MVVFAAGTAGRTLVCWPHLPKPWLNPNVLQIVARLMKLELDLKSEKQRREAAEAEMKEITKAMSSRPAVVTAKPT